MASLFVVDKNSVVLCVPYLVRRRDARVTWSREKPKYSAAASKILKATHEPIICKLIFSFQTIETCRPVVVYRQKSLLQAVLRRGVTENIIETNSHLTMLMMTASMSKVNLRHPLHSWAQSHEQLLAMKQVKLARLHEVGTSQRTQ
ncbi:hypothetical protein LSAT2_027018 [Lamellibrachia satsuma]|nr:hypothetical protein LSAT2_027018 [Lamellibrachia satsuma]